MVRSAHEKNSSLMFACVCFYSLSINIYIYIYLYYIYIYISLSIYIYIYICYVLPRLGVVAEQMPHALRHSQLERLLADGITSFLQTLVQILVVPIQLKHGISKLWQPLQHMNYQMPYRYEHFRQMFCQWAELIIRPPAKCDFCWSEPRACPLKRPHELN